MELTSRRLAHRVSDRLRTTTARRGTLHTPSIDWAVDAAGTSVPTHYSISGLTLTQTIDTSAGGFSYPIVADPDMALPDPFPEAEALPEWTRAATSTQLTFSDSHGLARAGIANATLLRHLHTTSRDAGHVVWILTGNPSDRIHNITVGMTVTQAATHLRLPAVQRVGRNDWYLAPDGTVTAMLRAQHGQIVEIGIAVRNLSDGSRHRRLVFLTGF